MSILRQKASPIREKRLFAIGAYYGKAEILLSEYEENEQFTQRVRTFSQDSQSDILTALNVISTIKDAAVIVHGAAGCGVGRLSLVPNDENNTKWAVTNLNERDSIMGSGSKLQEAILQIYKLHEPKLIFIVLAPIVSINNDDIESVVEELKGELETTIIPVYSVGFRSKIGSTGLDLVSHSILKRFFKINTEVVPSDYVNLLTVAEKKSDVTEATRLLNELGLKINLFPRYTSYENIKQVSNASFSISVNPDDSIYPGEVLKERFDIPYIQSVIPIGIDNTSQWITDIAIATDRKKKAHELLTLEKEKLFTLVRKKDNIKPKIFISLTPAYGIAVIKLVEELGYEIVGYKFSFLDNQHLSFVKQIKDEKPDIPVFVGNGQYFEEENVIRKIKPELYIGSNNSDFTVAVRNGIPVINIDNFSIFGFNGVINFANKITKTLANTSFVKSLASSEAESDTYKTEWLRKSTNWFIKQEVK
jgi:nitrogenase molybdenum-iron protein alpha chain